MSAITVEKLGRVGARVEGVDGDRLLHDDSMAAWCMETLEENGVLVFPELHIDDATQVAFTRRLGEPVIFHTRGNFPEIYPISLDRAKNPGADYLRGTIAWHIDGAQDAIPAKATLLSAKVLAESGGETEFASTYVAYDELADEEKERFASLRVDNASHALHRRQLVGGPRIRVGRQRRSDARRTAYCQARLGLHSGRLGDASGLHLVVRTESTRRRRRYDSPVRRVTRAHPQAISGRVPGSRATPCGNGAADA